MKNTFEDFLGVLGKLLHSKTTSTIPSDPRLKPCPRHTQNNTGRRETLMRKHLSELFVTLTVVLSVVGCTMLTSKQETSLYERLGGQSAIEAVVNDFVDRVGADTRITNEKVKARLAVIHIPTLKWHVTNQVCMATGGPCDYKGRDMTVTHAGLEITNVEFDYVVDDLVKTLDQYKVPAREKK
jgi:hemoglobin